MWFFIAVLSALFVGISTILSKLGIKETDSYAVGAVTNTVILGSFAGAAFVGGTFGQTAEMGMTTWISVGLSGAVLAVSWTLYYLGLKGGNISVFLAIQSLSVIFSMILCAVFLKEHITSLMTSGAGLIVIGIFLMIEKPAEVFRVKNLHAERNRWMVYSLLSAFCAAVSYVIVKADTAPIDTNVTSFFRYILVTAVLWGFYLHSGRSRALTTMGSRTLIFVLLGAAASAAGHVLVYKALFFGKAAVVMTVYRMGMVISVILSKVFLKEKMTAKGWIGFILLVIGITVFSMGR